MKRMKDNPYLIITPRLPTGTQEGSPTEPSDPDSSNLGNKNESDNLESTTSLVNSPVGGTTQPETGWVSIETHVPNPLSKLIHKYSDDESLEPSHNIPNPEVKTMKVLQNETEDKSGLNVKEPDTLETRADLKEKLKSGESKKESPQKEINSSVANKKLSNESVPDISILPNTQIPDE
jgi:hypothetical protein